MKPELKALISHRQALSNAVARLTASGAADPGLDAQWLLAEVLCVPRLSMLLSLDEPLAPQEAEQFEALLSRRESGEPLQYTLEETYFMGHAFYIDPRVLIPRSDTEALCEEALKRLSPTRSLLDIGTGSGAIAISLALACPESPITGVDISTEALAVARINGEKLGGNVTWKESDLFSGLERQTFDIILSNPPYIKTSDLSGLQPEVRREPRLALDGGMDGLGFYRRILAGLPEHLAHKGSLLLEVGDGQANDVAAWLDGHFETIRIVQDLRGLDRVVTGDGYAG